jgi:hypothetical protein
MDKPGIQEAGLLRQGNELYDTRDRRFFDPTPPIRIELGNDGGSASTEITVARAEISKYFRLPADMANDASTP